MNAPRKESAENKEHTSTNSERRRSLRQFVVYLGPALMVSMAYMDPGNYGTDLAAGAGYKYDLVWAVWLASAMAMILQYLSGKIGIATGKSLAEMVKISLVRKSLVIPYWVAAEAAAAATDLAEYLGTVIALHYLFGVQLLYAAIFGALDVLIIMTLMTRRFRVIEQIFMLLISVLVFGFLYQLISVGPSISQIAVHSITVGSLSSEMMLLVVGIIGATVMPHALFIHSWLTKNKMDLSISNISRVKENRIQFSREEKHSVLRLHKLETIVMLTIAGLVNVGILLVATPLFPKPNITIGQAVSGLNTIFFPLIGVVFLVTLLASGILSSTLGTLAGQVIMEDLIGKHWNIWIRRIVTRCVNVFPTTIAILLGLDPLRLLIYSQVILSLMIPLPMMPLVYYTSKRKFMGEFVNRRITIAVALMTVSLILAFNIFLLATSF
ncbi:MAG: Nramp family divalent metal transporter [Nitrososphaerota archaeon]|nr:Nramp family divalent metal transporter [Nitrososphaerota archaeon]MDG6922661.1 Nramp family divalent metal transporter [Nitrososphaerota archaeon]